jgi:hypothetical protein
MAAVVTGLTVISLMIGFGVEGVFRLAQQATATAMDQQGYALAVQKTLAEVKAKGLNP